MTLILMISIRACITIFEGLSRMVNRKFTALTATNLLFLVANYKKVPISRDISINLEANLYLSL